MDIHPRFRPPSVVESMGRAKRAKAQVESKMFRLALAGSQQDIFQHLDQGNVRGFVGDTLLLNMGLLSAATGKPGERWQLVKNVVDKYPELASTAPRL